MISITTMQARQAQRHQAYLVKNYSPLDWGYQEALHRLAGALEVRGINATDAIVCAHALLYGELQRQASMLAFADVFRFMAALCLAMVPVLFLMKKSAPSTPTSSPLSH